MHEGSTPQLHECKDHYHAWRRQLRQPDLQCAVFDDRLGVEVDIARLCAHDEYGFDCLKMTLALHVPGDSPRVAAIGLGEDQLDIEKLDQSDHPSLEL